MATARDLVKGAMRLLGALASGETPSANELADGLSRLNSMIKSWSIEGLMVYQTTIEEFSLPSGQASQTMGVGGDFNSTRPNRIVAAAIKRSGVEYPIDILGPQEWAGIINKSLQSNIPQKLYVQGSFPLETLYPWPIPSETNTLVLHSLKPISSTLQASDTISLPDGYEEPLEYNLALRLAPEFGRQVDPLVLNTAMDLKAGLMRQNTRPVYMTPDTCGIGIKKTFNIETGV